MTVDPHSALVLVFKILSTFVTREKCCKDLECFSLNAPWFSLIRPVPPPECQDECPASFYMYSRNDPSVMFNATGWPIELPKNTTFDGNKTTVVFIPGWYYSSKDKWYEELKDAFLRRVDVNYIFLSWEKCAQRRYLDAVSSTRTVGAQAIRFLKYLFQHHNASPSRIHLVGMSLGVHIASYIAKGLGGVKRITGLQPTMLFFDGFGKEIELDAGDADFVEIGYTESLRTHSKGHVDYYFNGYLSQPGCIEQVGQHALQDLNEGIFDVVKIFQYFIACNHVRVLFYYINSIKDTNCTLWGEKAATTTILFNKFTGGIFAENTTNFENCTINTCIPWGLEAINYPARGSFFVVTNNEQPFCVPKPNIDIKMAELLKYYKNNFYRDYNDNNL